MELSGRNFGLLIAYVLPGFVALWGVSAISPPVSLWFTGAADSGPTVGSFMYLGLGSIAAGMTVSAVRWAIVDSLHHGTGIPRPNWDDSHLHERLPAYEFLIEIHYRYYQFYANMLVALIVAHCIRRFAAPTFGWLDIAVLLLAVIFTAGSRDTLRNYYRRTAHLLGTNERNDSHDQRWNPSLRQHDQEGDFSEEE